MPFHNKSSLALFIFSIKIRRGCESPSGGLWAEGRIRATVSNVQDVNLILSQDWKWAVRRSYVPEHKNILLLFFLSCQRLVSLLCSAWCGFFLWELLFFFLSCQHFSLSLCFCLCRESWMKPVTCGRRKIWQHCFPELIYFLCHLSSVCDHVELTVSCSCLFLLSCVHTQVTHECCVSSCSCRPLSEPAALVPDHIVCVWCDVTFQPNQNLPRSCISIKAWCCVVCVHWRRPYLNVLYDDVCVWWQNSKLTSSLLQGA